jgi:hypothetical protein
MAATAIVEGHFVNAVYGEWDTFKDNRSGESVPGGRRFLINVHTPHDDDLVLVRAFIDNIDELRKSLSPATFGTTVRLVCGVNKGGTYTGYSAEVIPASSKVAPVKAA